MNRLAKIGLVVVGGLALAGCSLQQANNAVTVPTPNGQSQVQAQTSNGSTVSPTATVSNKSPQQDLDTELKAAGEVKSADWSGGDLNATQVTQ